MLSKLVRTALWLLLHCVYIIVDRIFMLCLYIQIKSAELFNSKNIKHSFEYVNLNLRNVSKKPHHLVFILDNEHLSYAELSKLVIWSLAAGISYFSFYDHTGLLNKNEDKLYKAIKELKACVPGYIKWRNQPDLNGCVNSTPNKMIFTLLSGEHGKQTIVTAVQNMCKEVLKGNLKRNDVDMNYLNNCIDNECLSLPEPNVVIYCSEACRTYGLLPWHLRLTEFLRLGLPIHHSMNEIRFVNVLKKYGDCEQRFGK